MAAVEIIRQAQRIAIATAVAYAVLLHAMLAPGFASAAPTPAGVLCGQASHHPVPSDDEPGCCLGLCCVLAHDAWAPPPVAARVAALRHARPPAWPRAAPAVLRAPRTTTGSARGPPRLS